MKVSLHNFGNFKLDGGAMFGPVPKPVWSKLYAVDTENRILMASNTLVIEEEQRRIIIDLGMGNNFSEKVRERYDIANRLEVINPETITDVIFTHLHFDHTGGILTLINGKPHPSYPNATYHLQKMQWEEALNPSIKEKNAYAIADLNFLSTAKVNFIEDEQELLPGITAHISNGHTRGLQWLKIKTSQTTIAFVSDLIPTAQHLSLSFHMSYDINPELLIREKLDFLETALKEKMTVIFQHDPYLPVGQILKTNGRYQVLPTNI